MLLASQTPWVRTMLAIWLILAAARGVAHSHAAAAAMSVRRVGMAAVQDVVCGFEEDAGVCQAVGTARHLPRHVVKSSRGALLLLPPAALPLCLLWLSVKRVKEGERPGRGRDEAPPRLHFEVRPSDV
eukprot:83012-Chlamydomonas_euryale.AAC.1